MSQPALRLGALPSLKLMLKIESGPDVGAIYQLLPPRATIGRGTENHIVLNDPKVSRTQAEVVLTGSSIMIRDMSSRGTLIVNGTNQKECVLNSGDRIRIGDSELKIYFEAPSPNLPPRKIANASASGGVNSSRVRFYVFVVVAFGGLGWMIYSDSGKPRKTVEVKTIEQVESEISTIEKASSELERRQARSEEEQARFEEANRHFHQGFRDYNAGEYVNAIRSFETAKSIDPTHPLAQRYSLLAQRKRDEQIAEIVRQAHVYRDRSMYRMCSGIAMKALTLMPNKQDLKFQEANALRKECDALEKERSSW